MKDIAHRGLDSRVQLVCGESRNVIPALHGTRVRIYAVSFSRLEARSRNIDLQEQRLPFLLSEMQNRSEPA